MKTKVSKTLLFLIAQPLDQRNYSRFGIDYWEKNGWSVKVFDLTPFLFPKVWASFLEQKQQLRTDLFYKLIFHRSEFYKQLLNEKPCVFLDLVETTQLEYLMIKKRLLELNFLSLTLRMGAMPLPVPYNASFAERILARIKNVFSKREGLFSLIKQILIQKYYNFSFRKYATHTYRVVSGDITYQEAIKTIDKDRIIKAHNFDYDLYMSSEKKYKFSEGEYILFIDEDMAYHSDFIYQNTSSPVKPENYFNSIRNFLMHVANKKRCKIKIAAHPRSNYTGDREFAYGDIPIYKGATDELIKSAKLVIGHTSTSFQFAVLYKIPILFITTDDLINSTYNAYIEKFSKVLHRPIINVDENPDNIDWQAVGLIDTKIYEKYIYDYIKSEGSPEEYSMSIISNYLLPFVSSK